MANRDMVKDLFSFEKMRKLVECHAYFGSTGAVTLDAQGSKGVLSITKVATPAINGLYTIVFGVSANSINYLDMYVKTLNVDGIFETEYTGNNAPAAPSLSIFHDDVANTVPMFGDIAPVQSAPAHSGADGSFAGGQAFKWLVTAVDPNGNETQLSTALAQEQSDTPSASNHETITWAAVAGAGSYNVYRTAAAGGSGAELVFVGNTTALTLNDLGTAATSAYQGGSTTLGGQGQKVDNWKLPAYSSARPPFGYCSVTVVCLNGTTPTNPAAGEGVRIQVEFGDSSAP